jgi:epoxide hydrolase
MRADHLTGVRGLGVEPFVVEVSDEVLDDLSVRLSRLRLPARSPVADWSDGTPEGFLVELLRYWRDDFDWPSQIARINQLAHYRCQIMGQGIHFVHARSANDGALPLLVTHGWPGSVWEFNRIIPMLTDPEAYGGSARDAFHVICPSLPGYGWSDVPSEPGCTPRVIASYEAALMSRLGYTRYGVQGGDWGSRISAFVALDDVAHVVGLHLNTPQFIQPPPDYDGTGLSEADLATLNARRRISAEGSGYRDQQSTRPQTLAYGLSDSPAGLAAWITEKFQAWSDGGIDASIGRDDLLTNIMIYWCTNTIGSSIRLYKENARQPWTEKILVPAGCAIFPHEVFPPTRGWIERFLDIQRWTVMPRGGHFAALEQPELLVGDIRAFFRPLR